ncbi:MAG TPA: gluconate 2-dehydrogenase subunit 3 family protein [Verrucomicrobiae bacterium]|nr:gluconate 2-dehydrogenase subunit 3 family protein [Verrucomicrobiae bacterium]
MPYLKLPRALPGAAEPLAPELLAPEPPPPPTLLLGRRAFLKGLGVVLAAMAAPLTGVRQAYAAARGRFFTGHEFATLSALCDRVVPPDHDPGARALGAAHYIERMLTAFDHRVPLVFAGGPFSNRNPFPDNDDGTPSRRRPKDAFRHFIPLTRVQAIRWRAELFGSAEVPGADFNDALLGPLTGLRTIYRQSLRKVDQTARKMHGKAFVQLPPKQQDAVFAQLDTGPASVRFAADPRRGVTFIDLLIQHTLEGCFTAPEYGGNHRARGWKMLGIEGDDQPLGYSIFSRAKGDYNERPDHPMSTPNPDELSGPRPISADADRVQDTIIAFSQIFGT